jgi:Right handed beta helix region
MTGIIDSAHFGMPDATTAGVPAGTTLTAYTGPMTITTPGTVIDGKIISGTLRVTAADVTIKNCVVQNYGWWGIDAEGAANITIQNCDFTASSSMDTNAAILGSGTFIGNDIRNSENGIVLTGGASVVRDNYIHDLQDSGPDPHIDGISVQGGQNHVLIEHNTVESWDTSCIFIKNDFGPINDITVRNNLLYGDLDRGDPAATIYVWGPNTTNVSITNNYLEKGFWFYYQINNANPTISGNIEWNNNTDPTPYPNSPGGNAVVSATLVNADTDLDIMLLMNDMVLDFSNLPAHLSVRANTDPSPTGSVAFDLDGITHIENILPYAIAGDNQGDYNPWTPTVGMHTLVLTPYSGGGGTGQAGVPLAISFNVLPPSSSGNAVVSATLVDADTNLDILQLESGMTLDFSMLPTHNLSVRANTEPSHTGSVAFDLDGITHVENILPYAIAGDDIQGDYNPWTPEAGSHSLVMTPYSGPAATGQPGAPLTIHFDILA